MLVFLLPTFVTSEKGGLSFGIVVETAHALIIYASSADIRKRIGTYHSHRRRQMRIGTGQTDAFQSTRDLFQGPHLVRRK